MSKRRSKFNLSGVVSFVLVVLLIAGAVGFLYQYLGGGTLSNDDDTLVPFRLMHGEVRLKDGGMLDISQGAELTFDFPNDPEDAYKNAARDVRVEVNTQSDYSFLVDGDPYLFAGEDYSFEPIWFDQAEDADTLVLQPKRGLIHILALHYDIDKLNLDTFADTAEDTFFELVVTVLDITERVALRFDGTVGVSGVTLPAVEEIWW